MLSSITPLGERAKNNSWALTASAYVAGSALGGAALGLVLSPFAWLAEEVPDTVALVVLSLLLITAAVLDSVGASRLSLPRQVDENWLNAYRGWVYGAGFGLQLGFGLVTIITSWSMWAVVAAAVLAGSSLGSPVAGAMAVGTAFGLVRGLVLLAARGADDPAHLAALHQRIARGAKHSSRTTIVSLGVLGVIGLVGATITGGLT